VKLIDQPLRVVLLAYSFWAQVLGLLALILPEVIFATTGIDLDPAFLWWSAFGLLLFGLAGRLIQQTGSALRNALRIAAVAALILLASMVASQAMDLRHEPPPPPGVAAASWSDMQEAATLVIALPLVARLEGKRNQAYIPIPGDVPTICYGSTEGVRMGDYATDAQCLERLRREVVEYRKGLHRYWTTDTLLRRLPPTRDAAFTSFAINVGVSGAGKSTAARRLNAGDVPGACDALTWWNKAGGRVIRGLVARRAEERDLCLA